MKLIKCLVDFIEDELEGAEGYAKKAMEIKEEYPEIADVLWMMSNEEMKHMQNLHTSVTKLISEYKEEHGDPPAAMEAVYDYLHKKYVNEAKGIKILQDMYRS